MTNDTPENTSIADAMKWAKAVGKGISYVLALLGAVWYLRGQLDGINNTLYRMEQQNRFRPSIIEVNHAFKTMGDQNRDLMHKDGTMGLLVPELAIPAAGTPGEQPVQDPNR